MTELFKMVNGRIIPLSEEDLAQREIDELNWLKQKKKINHWKNKRLEAYKAQIDPNLMSAIAQLHFDNDNSELIRLGQIRDDIKSIHRKNTDDDFE